MKRHLFTILLILTSASFTMAAETTFSPRLTVKGEYTDNFYRSSENEEDEYITTVAPGATLALQGATAGLTLSYDPTYVSYSETEEDAKWRHYGVLTGNWDASRQTHLGLKTSVTISEDPADDDESSTISRGRNRYARYTGDAGISHRFGREDIVGGGYRVSLLENEEDYVEDSQEHKPYFDLTKWFGDSRYGLRTHMDYTLGTFNMADERYEQTDGFNSFYGYLRMMRKMSRQFDIFVQYAHTVTEYDGDTENYSVYNPSIGFTYDVEKQTTINMALGYLIRDREQSDDDSEMSFTGDVKTSWQFTRGTINLAAVSGYRQESFSAENLGFSYFGGADAGLNYDFTRRFGGDLNGRYRYDRYLDSDPEITDNTVDLSAGLSYQVLQWTSLRLEFRHRTVSSSLEEREYDENRVWLSVTFQPENPLRLN